MKSEEQKALNIANKHLPNTLTERMVQKLGEEVMELAMAVGANDHYGVIEEIGDCAYILSHLLSKYSDKGLIVAIVRASKKLETRVNTGYYEKTDLVTHKKHKLGL